MKALLPVVTLMRRRRLRYSVLAIGWCLLFLTVAWPTWKRTQENDARIRTTSSSIEALTRMASAGAWFQAAALSWEPVQKQHYDRLFPFEKQREELFLQLAKVANEAKVHPFTLREVPMLIEQMTNDDMMEDMGGSMDESDLSLLVSQFATDMTSQPSAALSTYAISASFIADYRRMAGFLEGLQALPRALTVRSLNATSNKDGIEVNMELEFYVQSTD